MTPAITVKNTEAVTVEIDPSSATRKVALLTNAAEVTVIDCDFLYTTAVDVQRNLKRELAAVESARVSVKAPVLELGRKIDAIAKSYCAELDAEANRIGKLITAFNAEVESKRQEEIRAREAELKRIEAEQRAKEEAARKVAEAEAAKARNESERVAAQARAQAEAERIARESQAKQQAAFKPVIAALKVEGVSTREVWKFEVTDIDALLTAHRALVKVEADAAAINESIRRGTRSIPGLRIWSEQVSIVRK